MTRLRLESLIYMLTERLTECDLVEFKAIQAKLFAAQAELAELRGE